jgi:hypothetical protein
MTTAYPTSLDNLPASRGTAGSTLASPDHVQHHTNEDDAIAALEVKVGVDNSAVSTSLDYKVKNTSSVDPGHKHTKNSVTLGLSELSDTNIPTTPSDGSGLFFDAASGKWKPGTANVADASTTVKGVTKLSVAPVLSTVPIAVGDNDPRFITHSGTTLDGSTNKLIDDADVAATATASKVARRNSNGDIAVNSTPTNSTDAASKAYVDTGNSFLAGVVTDLNISAAGNNDISVTTTFTPRLIRIYYWIQGHDAGSQTNTFQAEKGIAVFNGTTLQFVNREWQLTNTTDNVTPTASSTFLSFPNTPNNTSSPTVGNAAGSSSIQITLSIASVSSSSFVIRRATVVSSSPSNARAVIAYEAFA